MKKVYITLLAVLITCTASFAQDKAKDIKKLIELTGAADMSMQIIQQSIDQARADKAVNVPKEFWDEFMKQISKDDLVNMVLPLYDKYYTHDEIKQLTAFYATPVGQKSIQIMPKLMQESMASGEQLGREVGMRVLQKMQAEGKLPK